MENNSNYPTSKVYSPQPTYATAVPVVVQRNNDDIPEHIVKAYQLSKTVKLFAMIDIIFGFFYAFYSFFYLIPLLIAIYGYYSAKNYNASGVMCYTVYQILINVIRLALSIYTYVLIRQDGSISDYSMYNWYIAFAVFSTLLGLYIARFGYKLYKSIRNLNHDEKERLILLNYPIRVIYW